MEGFWAASWLHCPPEDRFAGGRRVILKKLCFGPVEERVWFVTCDGRCWYEERIGEGIQAGETLRRPVSPAELRSVLENECGLCRSCGGERFLPLFQAELNKSQN